MLKKHNFGVLSSPGSPGQVKGCKVKSLGVIRKYLSIETDITNIWKLTDSHTDRCTDQSICL